ncbi:MAG: glycosyltransferase family 4 protein [Desulfomonilaceae bacterium]
MTAVACPTLDPPDFLDGPGLEQVNLEWNKPQLEHPLVGGAKWLAYGIWRDVGRARAVIRQVRPSLVHVNGAILIAGVIAARLEKVPTVWHLNDVSVPRLYARVVKSLSLLCGATIIAASNAVIDYYCLNPSTQVVYPPAPKVKIESDITPRSTRRIGTLTNLSPSKGVERIIDAMVLLREEMPGIELEVGGRILENKRWYYELLRDRIAQAGLQDIIRFVGLVRAPIKWLRQIDLLVFCSEAEAAPVAVIEAMSCAIPVVATDIPATREILGDAGIVVSLGDTEALAASIKTVLSEAGTYEDCASRGLRRSDVVFSVDRISAQYSRLYNSLVA